MRYDLKMVNASNRRVRLPTNRAYDIHVKNNKHGYGSLEFAIDLNPAEIALFYANPQVQDVTLWSAGNVFNGRLEDVSLQGTTMRFTALGYWSALGDIPYTAFWSKANFSGFEPVTFSSNRSPEKYELAVLQDSNELRITPKKNEVFSATVDFGEMTWYVPINSTRNIIGVSFTVEMNIPTGWIFRCHTYNQDYSGFAAQYTLTGTSSVITRSVLIVGVFSAPRISFFMRNNTGANAQKVTDTGVDYIKVTNIRLVSSNTHLVNTTLGSTILAGTRSVSPASMANIFIGQQLVIANNTTTSEIVTVTAMTSTTFTAVFAFGHSNTDQVQALVVTGDDILKDIVSTINTANPTQLASNTSLVQDTQFDLPNEDYQDENAIRIAEYVANLGNGLAPWEVGVFNDKTLYFRPQKQQRSWYINLTDIDIETSLSDLYNSVYATYTDQTDNVLRTATYTDRDTYYGIIRRKAIDVDTVLPYLAALQAQLALNDTSTIKPRANITVTRVYGPNSVTPARLSDIRPGDTITIKNLPPTVEGTAVDRIRTFRVIETDLDVLGNKLSITPELPLPTLDYMLAVNRFATPVDDVRKRR